MSKLIMLMGAPGSGKSTFAKAHMKKDDVYVSRDEIRLSMLKPGEDYFLHEKKVFKLFVAMISKALDEGKTVWADATHLNYNSRAKLLIPLSGKRELKVDIIWMETTLQTCLKRNDKRRGTSFYVPIDAVCDMYRKLSRPQFREGFDNIYIVEEDGKMQHYTKRR